MSEPTQTFLGTTISREDAHLFPEISSYTNESADISREVTHIFPGMNSRLYRASECGHIVALNKLIEDKDKFSISKEFTRLGNSALHIALSCGNLRFTERLLQEVNTDSVEGCEFVRARNSEGNSALHFAAYYGHHKLVETFIGLMKGDVEGGNFLRSVNCEGNSALHEAAKRGSYMVVDVLLEHCGDLVSLPNREGETALFIACQNGHTKIVERLLPLMHSNSNMKRRDGQTPLHSAVLYRHTGVVKKLLQDRTDLAKQIDESGRTALHMFVLSGPDPGFMELYLPLGRNFVEIARLLLEKDNSLCYTQDNKKQTPLHMAVELEMYNLVRILLRHGRDCREMLDSEGRTPLHLAVINAVRSTQTYNFGKVLGFRNMLLSLMSRESLNHRDNRGRTPLHIALENIEKDAALYKNIIERFEFYGARMTREILEDTRRIELPSSKSRLKAENISLNAVLIATVSFAAAFTLPGGLVSQPGENPKAVFINTFLFQLFLICDTFSFCASIASAILVLFAEMYDQQDQPLAL